MKKFFVTVDAEGDNLWEYGGHHAATTQNAQCIPRFQKLCERFGMKPVYLSDHEMIMDDSFANYVSEKAWANQCEIGMHLHAWNTPPDYELEEDIARSRGLPYLIEYPKDVMGEKIRFMTEQIMVRTGMRPVSHRAGRWAMNPRYFDLLIENGYLVDCSATPHVSWKGCPGYTANSSGTDYSAVTNNPYTVKHTDLDSHILEMPMSISPRIRCIHSNAKSVRNAISIALKGSHIWMRFLDGNFELVNAYARKNTSDYLMFMLHSSELMPGCSKYFQSEKDVETLYRNMEKLFSIVSESYEGVTLKEYYSSVYHA